MGRKAKIIRFLLRRAAAKRPESAKPGRARGFVEAHRCRDQSEALVLKGFFASAPKVSTPLRLSTL